MKGSHLITLADGTTEECWCSSVGDHDETEGDWDLFAEADDKRDEI
jgi:hypothetical protein